MVTASFLFAYAASFQHPQFKGVSKMGPKNMTSEDRANLALFSQSQHFTGIENLAHEVQSKWAGHLVPC